MRQQAARQAALPTRPLPRALRSVSTPSHSGATLSRAGSVQRIPDRRNTCAAHTGPLKGAASPCMQHELCRVLQLRVRTRGGSRALAAARGARACLLARALLASPPARRPSVVRAVNFSLRMWTATLPRANSSSSCVPPPSCVPKAPAWHLSAAFSGGPGAGLQGGGRWSFAPEILKQPEKTARRARALAPPALVAPFVFAHLVAPFVPLRSRRGALSRFQAQGIREFVLRRRLAAPQCGPPCALACARMICHSGSNESVYEQAETMGLRRNTQNKHDAVCPSACAARPRKCESVDTYAPQRPPPKNVLSRAPRGRSWCEVCLGSDEFGLV